MRLTYTKSDGTNVHYRLKTISHAKPITIGRGSEASIVLEDNKSSRIHAAIRYWDDIFVLRDVNSRNGTFLNGQKIDVAAIQPGDIITIGDTEIRVEQDKVSSDITVRIKPSDAADE